jgi:hypothetical protein
LKIPRGDARARASFRAAGPTDPAHSYLPSLGCRELHSSPEPALRVRKERRRRGFHRAHPRLQEAKLQLSRLTVCRRIRSDFAGVSLISCGERLQLSSCGKLGKKLRTAAVSVRRRVETGCPVVQACLHGFLYVLRG